MSKQELVARVLRASGLGWAIRAVKLWNGFLVANYHRVGDGVASRFNQDLFSATADDFEAQLRFFKHDFDVVGPDDLEFVRGAKRGRYIQITFDDGYRDNYEIAYPILRAQGLSATFFVATGYLDSPSIPWWDEIAWMVRGSKHDRLSGSDWLPEGMTFDNPTRTRSVRRLGKFYPTVPLEKRGDFLDYLAEATGSGRCHISASHDLWMTWDMVREMRRGGMSFGGHTVNHVELSRLSQQDQIEEIRGSVRRLEEELGEPPTVFSYPFGQPTSFNADTRAALRECGMKFAYTYHGGYQRNGDWDLHDLKRFAVETFKSQDLLHATVTIPQVFA
jgi:peptidoglycan/xylan/chitin deacetylase (PgdA/CDA1 family)